MLPDRLVLDIEDFPAVSYPQLVNGFGNELLDMEPVIDKLCAGKHVSDSKHHGRRKICRDGFYLKTLFQRDFSQYCRHSVACHATNHRRKSPFAATRGFVGQDRIDIAVAQTGLVKTHVLPEIFRIQYVFIGMIKLIPYPVITYLLLVLFTQGLTVEAIACGKSGDADRRAFNLPLLKKRQTRR